MSSVKTSAFENFVFHESFGIVWLLIRGAFSRMIEAIRGCIGHIVKAWSNNDSFLSFGTLKCLIITAFFGSITISYFVITSFTIVALAAAVASVFLLLTVLFATYQVLIGIIFGIIGAFRSYISSLIYYTFKA